MRTGRLRAGMTLLELLTVIVIFAILLGITASFMQGANRDLGVAAAANHAVGVLRVAHEESRSSSAPAWVVLDAKQGRIYLLEKETVGEWHLEDLSTTGAFGKDGKVSGGTLVQGRVGKAIQLGGGGSIAFGEVPYYDPGQGVAIEFWFLRHQSRGRGVLASVGKFIEVTSESDGHVEARVGSLSVSSGQMTVAPEAWCYLQLVYSGRDLKLILNRCLVQGASGKTEWTPNTSFSVGGSGFFGIMDEVRLGLIVPREEYYLAAECSIVLPAGAGTGPAGEATIGFDSEGRLDPSVTPQPFSFTIKSPAATQTITVGPGGTIFR